MGQKAKVRKEKKSTVVLRNIFINKTVNSTCLAFPIMDKLALQQIKKFVNIYHRKHYKVRGIGPLFDVLGLESFCTLF